jgi:hypothetical protein
MKMVVELRKLRDSFLCSEANISKSKKEEAKRKKRDDRLFEKVIKKCRKAAMKGESTFHYTARMGVLPSSVVLRLEEEGFRVSVFLRATDADVFDALIVWR